MNSIASQIMFWDLQRKKVKKNKKVEKSLGDNLMKFRIMDDESEFNAVYDSIFNNVTNVYITCNLFPENIELIGKYREVGFSNCIEKELRWHFKTISKYKEVINDFLVKREELDELIFCEKYVEAESIIKEIEKKYGLSLWLLEEKICVWTGLNKDTSEIIRNVKKNMLTSILDFYIMRASKDVSYTDYLYFVQREISKFLSIYPDSSSIVPMYHYMIDPCSFEINDDNIACLLEFIYNMPLFDRYLCMIDLCEFILISSKDAGYVKCVKDNLSYISDINDNTLKVLNVMSEGTDSEIGTAILSDPLLKVKNDFICGNMEECLLSVTEYIDKNKFNIQAYNILIEVLQLVNKNIEEIQINQISKEIIRRLVSVYIIDDKYNESWEVLRKKLVCCVHSWWARDLYNSIVRRNQATGSDNYKQTMNYSNMQQLTIETICENIKLDKALNYLESIVEKDEYLEFWGAYLSNDLKKISDICKIVEIRNLLNVDREPEFEHYYRIIMQDIDYSIMGNRYMQRLWNCISKNEEIEIGIDYFLKLFIVREEYAILAPINKFIEYIKYSKGIDKGDLRVPILQYIYVTYFDESKRDELTISCENFFDLNCIDKPSQMREFDSKDGNEKLIFFLKNVCIPRIMGPVLLSIRTDKGLDQERINTCQLLRKIDPENEYEYEKEILELTRKLFINEGLMSIESNKIHVNTDGLKSKLLKNLKSEFNGFMYYRNNQIDSVLKTIKSIEGGEKFQIITTDQSQMFNEIVYKIRNEFVMGGEYSLDGYLSINIRHGILDGQLRAPLAKYELLTTYRIEDDEYEVSQRWLYAVKNSYAKKRIYDAIVDFNRDIDCIIDNWKADLIQVSTEAKPSKGIFDYSLKESEVSILQTYLTENITLDEFIDFMFDYFWKRTEKNLKNMKKVINEEISSQINVAFEKLFEIYREIDKEFPFPNALRWLGSVKNEMDDEIEKISNWFNRSAESQQADFDIEYAIQMGLKMIQNIHPEKNFELIIDKKESSTKLSGKYLKCFWDIFYTQFDNISKYALAIDDVISVHSEMKVDGNSVYIKLINDYNCRNNLDNAICKLDAAMNLISEKTYLAKAKQEGGSGIPKIYKIMSNDLNMTTDINYHFDKEYNKFVLEVEGVYK